MSALLLVTVREKLVSEPYATSGREGEGGEGQRCVANRGGGSDASLTLSRASLFFLGDAALLGRQATAFAQLGAAFNRAAARVVAKAGALAALQRARLASLALSAGRARPPRRHAEWKNSKKI